MEVYKFWGIRLSNRKIVPTIIENKVYSCRLELVMPRSEKCCLSVVYAKNSGTKYEASSIDVASIKFNKSSFGEKVFAEFNYLNENSISVKLKTIDGSTIVSKTIDLNNFKKNNLVDNGYGTFVSANKNINKQKLYPVNYIIIQGSIKNKSDAKSSEKKKSADTKIKNKNLKNDNQKFFDYVDKAPKTKRTIRGKLLSIISAIVIIALTIVTVMISIIVSEDVSTSAQVNIKTINTRSADDVQSRLVSMRNSVETLIDVINSDEGKTDKVEKNILSFFSRNEDIACILLHDTNRAFINRRFFSKYEIDKELIEIFKDTNIEEFNRVKDAGSRFVNSSVIFTIPMISFFSHIDEKNDSSICIVFSSEKFSESFATSEVNTTYFVNSDGIVLASCDVFDARSATDFSAREIVSEMKKGSIDNKQMLCNKEEAVTFEEKISKAKEFAHSLIAMLSGEPFEYGDEYYGAYSKLKIGGCAVITEAKKSTVLEGVIKTATLNVFVAIAVLAIAILIIWFFSKSISNPVKALAAAANDVKQGNYDIELTPHTKDEVGLLTESFVAMGKGLKEREMYRDAISRFSSKDIADMVQRGELNLGGETREATIFFSDIRSFTAISEKLDPQEVVSFLNDYMTRMVECVSQTNGYVDKFIGDAVMAVWGVPKSSGSARQDAINCIQAALMMRNALAKFNVGRGGDKKPIIKIGCGINTGDVVAGQIGSTERSNYTVIGDAVNFASRTESLNKPLGTDILITENTYLLIKDLIITEEMPSVTVKGKEKPVKLFAVINFIGKEGPKNLNEVREMLGIPKPDLAGVNLDAEEKKYKIQGN